MKKNNIILNGLALLIIPAFLYADSLKSLLKYASVNNQLLKATTLAQKAKAKELEAQRGVYYPTVDVGLVYQRLDDRTALVPGDIYSGYAKVGFDIYDGGRKSSLVDQKKKELESSIYDTLAMKKNLSLQIVQDFYNIKNLEASLRAFKEAEKSLDAQLQRIKKFYEVKVATKDDVDSLQSAYDTNIYNMESVKFQILSAKKSLGLKVSKKIDILENSNFKELLQEEYVVQETTKSLIAKKESIISAAKSVESVYYPQIRVEDTYSLYDYGRSDTQHPEGLDNQNKVMLTLNLRLFDSSTTKNTKQSIIINAQALAQEISYQQNEQKMQHDLSKHRIQTSKVKIKSALSALVSATSAFKTVEEKYKVGIVDNVAYLNALTVQTRAKALYTKSLNDLEMAYAMYYYYSGKNLEEFLQ